MPKRRGAGEGSIFQRADGRWAAKVSIGRNAEGKLKSKTIYGKTRGAVSEALKKALRDQQLGIDIAPQRQTVATYLDSWHRTVVKVKNRPQTARSYLWLIESHLKPGLGSVVLEKLSPQQVREFLAERYASGLSAGTVKHLRATLRSALTVAEREGLVHRNVAKMVSVPTVERFRAKVLTPEQARELLRVAMASKHGPLFVLALATGLRKGELLGLRWADVSLEDGTLRVQNALERQKGKGLVLSAPKSERSKRALQVPLIAVKALQEQKTQQTAAKKWAGSGWVEGDFIFTTSKGTPLPPEDVNPELRKLLKAAKLPAMRLHDLRHSAATLLLSMGVHAKLVQEMLGHSSYQLTMDTYSHILPAMRNEVANRMDQVFGVSEGVKAEVERVQ